MSQLCEHQAVCHSYVNTRQCVTVIGATLNHKDAVILCMLTGDVCLYAPSALTTATVPISHAVFSVPALLSRVNQLPVSLPCALHHLLCIAHHASEPLDRTELAADVMCVNWCECTVGMSLSSSLEQNRFFFRIEDKRNIKFSQTLLIHSVFFLSADVWHLCVLVSVAWSILSLS